MGALGLNLQSTPAEPKYAQKVRESGKGDPGVVSIPDIYACMSWSRSVSVCVSECECVCVCMCMCNQMSQKGDITHAGKSEKK